MGPNGSLAFDLDHVKRPSGGGHFDDDEAPAGVLGKRKQPIVEVDAFLDVGRDDVADLVLDAGEIDGDGFERRCLLVLLDALGR